MTDQQPTSGDEPNDVLRHALAYAGKLGWRVVPIWPGMKHPNREGWQNIATTNEATIRKWWTDRPSFGVGIATGVESGIFVVDVDVSEGKHGDETLADLEAQHGKLPHTVEAITGSGGRHIYFRMPKDFVVHNDQAGFLGLHLDLRGEGGQVLAPPTIHPETGRAYAWEESCHPGRVPVADAPNWLVEILATPPPQRAPRQPRAVAGDAPGDVWAAQKQWADLLEADGARYLGTRVDRVSGLPYEMWARPGADHTSATLGYRGSDVLKVFTSDWKVVHPETGEIAYLRQGATYTKLGYLAATRFGGEEKENFSAAASWLAKQGYRAESDLKSMIIDLPASAVRDTSGKALTTGDDDEEEVAEGKFVPTTWEAVDLKPYVDGTYTPLAPTIGRRDDGACLLYEGMVNGLLGESGGGKSWVAQALVAEVLLAGGGAVFVDLEDHATNVTNRLLSLGVPGHVLLERFRYCRPEMAADHRALLVLLGLCDEVGARIVAIDSVGESMAMQAMKQNDDDDVVRWFRSIPRQIARTGPAVLLIDHVPKDPDAPSSHAIGSQRKKAAIDGASYRVETMVPFAAGVDGRVRLMTAKDRHGTYPTGSVAAMVNVIGAADKSHISFDFVAPEGGQRALGLQTDKTQAQVLQALEEAGVPLTRSQIRERVKRRKETVIAAVAQLATDGKVVVDAGDRVSLPTLDLASMIAADTSEGTEVMSLVPVVPVVPGTVPTPGSAGSPPVRGNRNRELPLEPPPSEEVGNQLDDSTPPNPGPDEEVDAWLAAPLPTKET